MTAYVLNHHHPRPEAEELRRALVRMCHRHLLPWRLANWFFLAYLSRSQPMCLVLWLLWRHLTREVPRRPEDLLYDDSLAEQVRCLCRHQDREHVGLWCGTCEDFCCPPPQPIEGDAPNWTDMLPALSREYTAMWDDHGHKARIETKRQG